MAEGYLRAVAGDRFEVASAGTQATQVHPLAIQVMQEIGVDLKGHTSKTLEGLAREPWDFVITVCDQAREHCPFFPTSTQRLHWSLADPSQAKGSEADRLQAFRQIRNNLIARIQSWLAGQSTAG